MDHIPIPANSRFQATKVPLVCNPDDYRKAFRSQPQSFHEYPLLRGFGREDFDCSGHQHRNIDQFFQEWLFFGILDHFLISQGVQFRAWVFIESDNITPPVVSTLRLDAYIRQWLDEVEHRRYSQEEKQHHLANMKAIFGRASGALRRYYDYSSFEVHEEALNAIPTSVSLFLSFTLLLKVLLSATSHAFLGLSPYMGSRDYPMEIAINIIDLICHHPLLLARLRSGNWCPSIVRHLPGFNSALLYLGLLPCITTKDHSCCSSNQCTADQINEDYYDTRYVENCPGCEHMEADQDLVCSILECGGIPVVSVTGTGSNIALEIIEVKPETKYCHIPRMVRRAR